MDVVKTVLLDMLLISYYGRVVKSNNNSRLDSDSNGVQVERVTRIRFDSELVEPSVEFYNCTLSFPHVIRCVKTVAHITGICIQIQEPRRH